MCGPIINSAVCPYCQRYCKDKSRHLLVGIALHAHADCLIMKGSDVDRLEISDHVDNDDDNDDDDDDEDDDDEWWSY